MIRMLEEYRIMPREYLEMDDETKAFIIAWLQIKDEEQEKEEGKEKCQLI